MGVGMEEGELKGNDWLPGVIDREMAGDAGGLMRIDGDWAKGKCKTRSAVRI